MTYRIEKKFRLSNSDLNIIKNELVSKGMTPLFPSRVINSIYFDTSNLSLFESSE